VNKMETEEVNCKIASDIPVPDPDTREFSSEETEAVADNIFETKQLKHNAYDEETNYVFSTLINDAIESEIPLKEFKETNIMVDTSSVSLPSSSENVCESNKNHSQLYINNEWEAADKEYMDITGEETSIEYIDVGVNKPNSVENVQDNVKTNTELEQDATTRLKALNFGRQIVQSEYEMTIQRQTRIKNMIRSKMQKHGNSSSSFESRESSIYETDKVNHFKSHQHQQEDYNKEKRDRINTEHQTVKLKETPKPELETEFYNLLNNLITELNTGNREHSISNKENWQGEDGKEKLNQTQDIQKRSMTKCEEENCDENIQIEKRVNQSQKYINNESIKLDKGSYLGFCDVSTQTTKIKKLKNCKIM